MKILFTVFLLHSLVFLAWSGDDCRRCPGQPPQEDKESACACGDLYHHHPTKSCVPLLVCILFNNPADLSAPLPSYGELSTGLSDLIARLINTNVETIPAAVGKLLLNLQSENSSALLLPKERALVRRVVMRNIRDTNLKTLPKMAMVFNPYIMSNLKLMGKCNGDKFCIVASVFGNDTKQMEKFIANLIPDWIDGIVSTMEGIAKAEKEQCGNEECPSIRFLSDHRAFIEVLLTHSKAYNNVMAKSIVHMFSKIDGYMKKSK